MDNIFFNRSLLFLILVQMHGIQASIWDYFHFNVDLFHVSTPVGAVSVDWSSRAPTKPRVMTSSIFDMPLWVVGGVVASGACSLVYCAHRAQEKQRHEKFSKAVKSARLLRAMREGSMREARYWLERGANVNEREYKHKSNRSYAWVYYNKKGGGMSRDTFETGLSVLEQCANHGDESMVRYCLNKGADEQSRKDAVE